MVWKAIETRIEVGVGLDGVAEVNVLKKVVVGPHGTLDWRGEWFQKMDCLFV